MAFDKLFKHLWRDVFSQYQVQANVAVGTLDLSIDLVLTLRPGSGVPATSPAILPDIVPRLSQTNLFEFKSARDKVPPHALHKLAGYTGLYCFQEKVPIARLASDITAWFVTAIRPGFLDTLLDAHLANAQVQGIYKTSLAYPCYIVVINEVPCIEANYPLLLLASGSQLRDAIRILSRGPLARDPSIQKYMYESYLLNYDELKSMTETEIKWPADVKRNVRHAIEDLGINEVIDAIGLKEVVKAVGLKEVVKAVGLKEVVKAVGLKEVVKAVGLKEVIDAVGLKEVIDAVGIEKVEQELKLMKSAKVPSKRS